PAGVVVDGIMSRMDLSGQIWKLYWNNVLANAVVALGGYLVFGGWRLFAEEARCNDLNADNSSEPSNFAAPHLVTLGAIGGLIVAVIGFGVQVGIAALAGAVLLTLARAADERQTIQSMPWSVIVMVCGVMT